MPPLRYNALSVLRNINLLDVEELNEVMHSLARCLDTTQSADIRRKAEQALAVLNKGPILRIVRAIESNPDWPLLRMAVERLLETRDRSRLEILGAVSELENLAEEKVLINPTVWPKEYSAALDDFLELPPFPFSKTVDGEEIIMSSPEGLDSGEQAAVSSSEQSQSQSDAAVIMPGIEKSYSECSTNSSPSLPVVKPPPTRKRLPSHGSSQVIQSKVKPITTPRKKGPFPLSEEYAVSSPSTSTPTTPKRGKATKACDECRRRKTKCVRDEGEEMCSSCKKMSRECVLSSPTPFKPSVRGSAKRAALEDLFQTPSKKIKATTVNTKGSLKNILHDFSDLEEGKALGILSDADDEDEHSSDATDDLTEIMDVSKTLTTVSDPEDFDYKPNKGVCHPDTKVRAKSIRKKSAINLE